MTFAHSWILFFLLLPVLWAAFEWRRTSRHLSLTLKVLTLLAIVVALAEPRLNFSQTKSAVAVLVDTSESVSEQDLAKASQFVGAVENARGRNWVRVLPFSRTVRTTTPAERSQGWHLQYTRGDAGRATDLETGILDAFGAMPAGMVPRLVLISDGKENAGTVTRAAWQAQNLAIPVDTVAMAGRPMPALRLAHVSAPVVAFTGEKFPIQVELNSPRDTRGTLEITAEGKSIGSQSIKLERGENHIQVNSRISAAGVVEVSGTVNAEGLGALRFERPLSLRRPKVLYVSSDPAGTEKNLIQALSSAQFDVEQTRDAVHPRLGDYQIVVLNNLDLEALPEQRKDDLEKFVSQGGGLLVLAGEHNMYAEGKTSEDALERALPAKLAPPRSPEGTAVVLIIDKSSSMEGRKIELARQAATGVIENLRPIDYVGVLIFDNSFSWAVPVRHAEDRSLIKRLVAGITPDGGTQIAPALAEAYRKILPVHATFKHIVLLTDGISEEGDSIELSKRAEEQHVTISTVGLGQDVNRTYLERVADFAGGKSYFLNDPAGLEQILLKDVKEHTGSTAVEKPLTAHVKKPAEILDGVAIDSAPALKGYVRFIAKPTADTILTVDENDPLLARWQYGLGRAAVFASDAKSRWAADWVIWKGYDTLWTNIFRDLLPHAQAGEAVVDYDTASGDLVVNYRLGPEVEEPSKIPAIFAIGPAGFQKPIPVEKIGTKSFRGRIHIGSQQGLFRIRPLQESRAFPETGYYIPEQELSDYGSNETLLRELAAYTGGRFNPEPKQVFDAAGRAEPASMRLWPALLAVAIAFNLAELILRKRLPSA